MDDHTIIYDQLRREGPGRPPMRAAADALPAPTPMSAADYKKRYGMDRPSYGIGDMLGEFAVNAQTDPKVALGMDVLGLSLSLPGLFRGPGGAPGGPGARPVLDPNIMERGAADAPISGLYDPPEVPPYNYSSDLKKPLNTEALQKMLGDMFEPPKNMKDLMGPKQIDAMQKGWEMFKSDPKNKGVDFGAIQQKAADITGVRPGDYQPPVSTLDEMMNLNIWGAKQGPWKHPLSPGGNMPAENIDIEGTNNRLLGPTGVMRDYQLKDFQQWKSAWQDELQHHTALEKSVNDEMRNFIMDEGPLYSSKNVIKKAFSSFLKKPIQERKAPDIRK